VARSSESGLRNRPRVPRVRRSIRRGMGVADARPARAVGDKDMADTIAAGPPGRDRARSACDSHAAPTEDG
jgi:hypothetical protein